MAGKRGSRRHSATSFSENVVVAGKSYQILEVLSFCDRERVKVTLLTFLEKNGKVKLCLYFGNTPKNFKSNLVLVVILVLESKVL